MLTDFQLLDYDSSRCS